MKKNNIYVTNVTFTFNISLNEEYLKVVIPGGGGGGEGVVTSGSLKQINT